MGEQASRVLLGLVGVGKWYGERTVLQPVDVDVRAGECVAVLGPNGSGKLSSGQAQAFALASALVRPRDLLVLDEPE